MKTIQYRIKSVDERYFVFIDPDATSRANPIYREFLHWLVVNVPENDLTQGEVIFS